jgi:hypothetical protein
MKNLSMLCCPVRMAVKVQAQQLTPPQLWEAMGVFDWSA